MRHKLVLWLLLLLAGFLIGLIQPYSRLSTGTAGTVCLDKTTRILLIQPTTVAAPRHGHHDVSGGRAKELWKGP